jgi:TetR/AcrR family transcriptional regulator, regulator of biofilm formation and stress response
MPDPAVHVDDAAVHAERDGRRRRGHARRRALVDAALTVIGRNGLAAVTQRSVATQAGVPPSAVYYYFATLDDLVAAALVEVNDRFIAELAAVDGGDDPLRALAVVTVGAARRGRQELLAELELWMLATREERLRGELDRWDAGVRATAAQLSDDPLVVDALATVVTGYYWQAASSDRFSVEHLEAIMRRIAGDAAGA